MEKNQRDHLRQTVVQCRRPPEPAIGGVKYEWSLIGQQLRVKGPV